MLGIKCAENLDVIVGGDFVIQIFFEKDTLKLLDKTYEGVETLDGMKKLYNLLFNKKTKITMVLFNNSVVAEQLREEVLDQFDR